MNTIPQAVVKAAEDRKHLGGTLTMVGKYKKQEVYTYIYAEPVTIGMPELYLWNGKSVQTIVEEQALELLHKMPI